jgi:heptosyltransferase-2
VTAQKVLIVGPAWVGDMVMAQSLYRLLKQREPDTRIYVLAPAWSLPLLARMPEITAGIELPVAHGELALGRRMALGRRLRAEAFDRAIVLPRSFKAALVPFFARIPVRTGFRGELRYGLINDVRPFDGGRLDQTVLRFVALGLARAESQLPEIPRPELTVDRAGAEALMARLELPRDRAVIALMPGAEYGNAKRWPTERYSDLAARLVRDGFAVWVLGSAKEAALAEEIRTRAGATMIFNLCGRTSLTEAADLLAVARVAVSNDSGLMHVAAAVGTHVVAIYGSSSPHFTPPLTAHKTIFYRALSCSPCFARECPLGHLNCLYGISVDGVLEAVEAVPA